MNLSRERLMRVAEQTGFRPEVLEKAIRLLGLLDGFRSHPFLTLTADPAVAQRIASHPMLQRKAENVRQYKGKPRAGDAPPITKRGRPAKTPARRPHRKK